jgi:hypothetical protein
MNLDTRIKLSWIYGEDGVGYDDEMELDVRERTVLERRRRWSWIEGEDVFGYEEKVELYIRLRWSLICKRRRQIWI